MFFGIVHGVVGVKNYGRNIQERSSKGAEKMEPRLCSLLPADRSQVKSCDHRLKTGQNTRYVASSSGYISEMHIRVLGCSCFIACSGSLFIAKANSL